MSALLIAVQAYISACNITTAEHKETIQTDGSVYDFLTREPERLKKLDEAKELVRCEDATTKMIREVDRVSKKK